MYFAVPLDMTAIEKRAYYQVANGHWLRKNRVYMVEAPIADAIAMGVDLENNAGSMIVNIGAQSTNFSIVTGGRIIINKKIPIGGRQMNEAVCSEVRKRYNLQIGTRTGKRLKLVMGRLADQHKQARKVVGIDSVSGLPREEVISAYVVNAGIMNCVNEIGAQMKVFLERIPPQISYHIAKEGIFLTGGAPESLILIHIWQVIQAILLTCQIFTKLQLSKGWRRSSTTKNFVNGLSPSHKENYSNCEGTEQL